MKLKTVPVRLSLLPTAALAQDQDKWTIRFDADGYVQSSGRTGEPVGLRQFDNQNERFRLGSASALIEYKNRGGRFGLTLQPWVGDAADILYTTEPGGSRLGKHLAQAFATVSEPVTGLNFTVGKFWSWIGFESALPGDSWFTNRGLLYTLAQPVYHAGVKVSKDLGGGRTAMVAGVGGWNQVEDSSRGVSWGGQYSATMGEGSILSVGFLTGREGGSQANRAGSFGGIGYPNAGSSETTIVDAIYSKTLPNGVSIGLNADFASASGANSGRWYGAALQGRKELSKGTFLSVRFEGVRDTDGLRTGQDTTVGSVAASFEKVMSQNVRLRLEARMDSADKSVFPDGAGTSSSQATLGLSIIVRY